MASEREEKPMITLTAATLAFLTLFPAEGDGAVERLPDPSADGGTFVEEALAGRRSVRSFTDEAPSLPELSALLWAAQGMTSDRGFRTAPSAGATYPLTVFAVVGEGGPLEAGVWEYLPEEGSVERILGGDVRDDLQAAALGQAWVGDAPLSLVIAGEYERTTGVYGDRGVMYVHMEAGHASQNVYLMCESLGLGTVCVAAFRDEELASAIGLPEELSPLYVMPVGHPEGG